MFPGFRGAHLPIPRSNPSDFPCDPAPDPFDTADFEVPHDKSMVEAFMAGLAKEDDNEYRKLTTSIDQPNEGWSRPLLPDHGEVAASEQAQLDAARARCGWRPISRALTSQFEKNTHRRRLGETTTLQRLPIAFYRRAMLRTLRNRKLARNPTSSPSPHLKTWMKTARRKPRAGCPGRVPQACAAHRKPRAGSSAPLACTPPRPRCSRRAATTCQCAR